jgi:hypothetical protein
MRSFIIRFHILCTILTWAICLYGWVFNYFLTTWDPDSVFPQFLLPLAFPVLYQGFAHTICWLFTGRIPWVLHVSEPKAVPRDVTNTSRQ